MMNPLLSPYGSGFAIGLSGTRAEIESAFNRFFNLRIAGHTATQERGKESGKLLQFMGDSFAYFLTSRDAIINGLTFENLRNWQDSPVSRQFKTPRVRANGKDRQKKKNHGKKFFHAAKNKAMEVFETFPRENFLGRASDDSLKALPVRSGSPDWDSDGEE